MPCCVLSVQGPVRPPGLRHGHRCVNTIDSESKCRAAAAGSGLAGVGSEHPGDTVLQTAVASVRAESPS